MRPSRFGTVEVLLAIVCAMVLLANGWYSSRMIQDSLSIDSLQASYGETAQNVRRLRTMDSLSASQQEVAQLRARLSSSSERIVPTDVDQLGLVFGLLDYLSGSGARLVGFHAQEVKTQTIDTVLFQLLGYDVTLEGNPFDMLTMVQRVDQNALTSLTIPALTLTKDKQQWNMKAVVVARLPSASQPAQASPAQPTPAPTKGTTPPTPTPARR